MQKILVTLLAMVLGMAGPALAQTRLKCASTTSTQNSGFFDYLLPIFQKKTGIIVDVVAVGTGAALEMGKRGDVDVVLVHAKELELKAVAEGWFKDRHDLMYNDFIIIGPPDDPLAIKGLKSAVEAFRKMGAQDTVPFVSRGDKSGTHILEVSLWKKAGLDPTGRKWYLEVGQGMEKTQRLANEKRAYTLIDRGTWLATKDQDKLDMAIVLEGDPLLFNQYGVMAVNPEKHRQAKYKEAKVFIDWLISPEGQKAIGDFRDKHGHQLFTPNAQVREGSGGKAPTPWHPLPSSTDRLSPAANVRGFRAALGLMAGLDRELLGIILLSLKVSGLALLLATCLGLPFGALLALKPFPLRGLLLSVLNTGMGLPPVVVGLILYLILSRSGPLGFLELLYTPAAMILAQTVLSFPIVASLSHAAIVEVNPVIRLAAQTLGATPFQEALAIIHEARYGIGAAIIAAFGRVTAEVGAVLLVGGNIAHYTRVMTTTIALETDKGNFDLGIALGMILLILSLSVNLALRAVQRRGRAQSGVRLWD